MKKFANWKKALTFVLALSISLFATIPTYTADINSTASSDAPKNQTAAVSMAQSFIQDSVNSKSRFFNFSAWEYELFHAWYVRWNG